MRLSLYKKGRLVVLISGSGSNLQAILDACQSDVIPAEVVCVVCDRKDAYGLIRAEKAGVPTQYLPWMPYREAGKTREDYDRDLADLVKQLDPDWIILAGWMRLLTLSFLGEFSGKIVNLHPALPGTYPGTHAIQRAWEDFQQGNIDHSGVMVHFVPDEGVDDGPVILTEEIPFLPEETLVEFEERVHHVEHDILIKAIISLFNS